MTINEKRQQKYPDTDYFTYYNANPKGKITTDCVARALSLGLNKPYNEVVMELAQLQCKTGLDNGDAKLYGKYLKSLGWEKLKQPKHIDGTKYTGIDFCKSLQKNNYKFPGIIDMSKKCLICNIGSHHIVCIKDNKIHDIWNCSKGKIGKIWIKI